MEDNRSKKFIFVPFCLMAQAYQAGTFLRHPSSHSSFRNRAWRERERGNECS